MLHPITTSLAELLTLQDRKELSVDNSAITSEAAEQLSRIFFVANEAEGIIERLEPQYTSVSALNGMHQSIQNATNSIKQFLEDGNVGHIANARNHIDTGAVPNFRNAVPISFETPPRTEAALKNYRKAAERSRRQQADRIAKIDEMLRGLQSTISKQDNRLAELATRTESLSSSTNKFLDEARTADQERLERFSKDFRELVDSKAEDFDVVLSAAVEKADSTLNTLDTKREEASAIVQSVGDLLTTGTYADRAEKETKKADLFRYITVGLFAFGLLIIVSNYLIFALGMAFAGSANLVEDWQSLLARVITGLAVALPAFYTARESARHRTNADIAKQRELEITTLGPFIELLPEEQKTAIRDRLTDRYFGGEVTPHDFKPPVDIEQLAKALAEVSKRSDISSA